MPDNKLKQFHDYIKGNPNISGVPNDFNTFQSVLKDPSKSKAFFDAISKNQSITGIPKDYNTFASSLGIVEKKNPNTPTASSGTANSTVSKPNPAFKTLDYGEVINKVREVDINERKAIKQAKATSIAVENTAPLLKALPKPIQAGTIDIGTGVIGLVGGLMEMAAKSPRWAVLGGKSDADKIMDFAMSMQEASNSIMTTSKSESGIEDSGKSSFEHLTDGNLSDFGKSITRDVGRVIPQTVATIFSGGSTAVLSTLGAVSAGQALTGEYTQDQDISMTDMAQSVAKGAAEAVLSKVFNMDILAGNVIKKGMVSKLDDILNAGGQVLKQKIKEEGKEVVLGQLIRSNKDVVIQGVKGGLQEVLEEDTNTLLSFIVDAIDEDKFNKESFDQLINDLGNTTLTSMATGAPISLLAAKISQKPLTTDEKRTIESLNSILQNPEISNETRNIVQRKIADINKGINDESLNNLSKVSNMSTEDKMSILFEQEQISKLENDVKSINDVDLKDEMLAEIERRKQGVSDILNSYSNEAKQAKTKTEAEQAVLDETPEGQLSSSGTPIEQSIETLPIEIGVGQESQQTTVAGEQSVSTDVEAKKADIERRRQENPSVERGVLINYESGKTKEQLIDIVNKLKNGEINLNEIIKEFFNLPINTLSEVKEAFKEGTLADKIQFGLDTNELSDLQPKTRSRESIINAKQKALFQKQKTEEALKDSEYKTVKKTDPITGKVTETKVKRTAEEKTKYDDFHKKALEDVNKEIEKYDAELKELENNNKTLPTNETEQTTGGEEIAASGVLQAQEAVSLDKSSVEIVTDENADKVKDKVKKLLIREGEGGPLNRFLSKASEFLASKSTVTQWVFDKLTAGNKMAVQAKEKAESFKGDIYDKANNILNGLIKTTGGNKGLISNAKKIISLGNLNDTIGKLVAQDVYTSMSNIIGNKYTPDEIKSALSKGDGIIDATKRNDILNSIKDINEDDIKKFKEDYANKTSDLVGEYININKPLKFKKEEVKLSQQPTGREALTRNITDVENDILSLPNGSKILSEVKLAIKNRDEARKILMSTEKGKKVLEYSENARALVDDLSREIELSPATKNISEKIGERVSGGEGFYLKRTFKYWKDKKFTVEQKQKDLAQKNIENTIYALKAPKFFNSDTYLKANPEEQAVMVQEFEKNISEDARIDMELYLDEIRRQRKDKGVFIPRSTTAKIDGRNLKSREILDETFLDLIGNTNDAISQFSDTVMAQAQILSAANLQYEINELAGEGLIYGSDREIIRERGDTKGYSQVNDPNGLLHNKWVRNDIYQVLSDGDFSISNNIASKAYYKTLGFMRKKNTIYNVATGWFTNLSGGFFNQVAQGLSVSPIITGKMLVGRLSYIFGGPSAKQQSFIQDAMDRMKAQGLWNTSVSAKFINALDQDYMSIMNYNELSGVPQKAIKKLSNELSKADKKMTAGYTSIDDFTKMLMFVQKQDIFARKLYGKKFDKLSKEEKFMVDTELAERIKQNIPTSSRLPGIYKSLLKVPLGDFIGFRISALQTSMNTYINAADDVTKGIELIKNGDSERGKAYLQDGMATIGAMGLISYLGNIGWQQVMSRIHGEEEDEEKVNLWTDYKGTPYLMPNWLRGRNAVVYKDDGLGNLVITNVSNKDPYDEFNGLVIGVKGMTRVERVKGVLGDVLNPNMLVQFLDNIRKGKDAWGDELVSGDATDSEKAMSYSRYITEQLLLPPAMLSTIRDSEKQARKKALEEKLKTDPEFEGEYERATISKKKLMEKRLELPYIDIAKESPDFLKNMIHRNYNVNIYNQFSFSIEELMENRKTKFEDLTPEQAKERIGDLSKVRDAYEYLVRYNATNEKAKNPEEFLNDLNKSSRKVNLSETEMDYIKTGVYSPENK